MRSCIRKTKKLMKKELPSEEHIKCWKNYEKLMMYRCNLAFVSKILFMAMNWPLGQANFQQSEKYIENGGEHNEEFVSAIFPYVKIAILSMSIGRVILLLISFKKLSICKFYIYYQVVYILLELCLPRNYGDMQLKLLMDNNVMSFCLLYMDFWPSSIAMLST